MQVSRLHTVALAALLALAPVAHGKPVPCPGGLFTLDAGPAADLVSGGGTASLQLTSNGADLGVCGPTAAHLRARKTGTRAAANWRGCGALKKLRLRGVFDPLCVTVTGTLAAKHVAKTPFVARAAADGPFTDFVSNAIVLPTNAPMAHDLAFDLDGDGAVDNAFGNFLTVLGAQNLSVQSFMDGAVQTGSIVLVHRLQANDLATDPTVSWQVWLGQIGGTPKFDGTDLVTPLPGGPTDAAVFGAITTGQFATTVPGPVSIQLVLASGPIRLDLHDARISATVSSAGCGEGRLGGALLATDVQSVFLPALAADFQTVVERDCPSATCMPGSEGAALETLFDADHDGTITASELATNTLIATVLVPDLDLQDGAGHPGHDGVADALSLGIGFTCVPVVFNNP